MAGILPVPGMRRRDREGDAMTGNRRALRVLAITSRSEGTKEGPGGKGPAICAADHAQVTRAPRSTHPITPLTEF